MAEKLYQLLYDYSIKNQIVSDSWMEQMINDVIHEMDLNDYVSKVEFIQRLICDYKQNIPVIEYYPTTKQLRIYANGIGLLLKQNHPYDDILNMNEFSFHRNLLIIQVILEKLEWIRHIKVTHEKIGMEAELLTLSQTCKENFENNCQISGVRTSFMEQRMRKNYQIYQQVKEFSPEKRIALIQSYRKLMNWIESMQDDIPKMHLLEQINLLTHTLNGYQIANNAVISPTIQYFTSTGYLAELSRFSWYDDNYYNCVKKSKQVYHLSDRMLYGLPIEEEEYLEIKNEIKQKRLQLK